MGNTGRSSPYPWGEPGPLEHETGLDENQAAFLQSLGEEVRNRNFDGQTAWMPVHMAETSGHSTGKSAMGAWITDWILSTRPGTFGTVTAGTATQLSDRYREVPKGPEEPLCVGAIAIQNSEASYTDDAWPQVWAELSDEEL